MSLHYTVTWQHLGHETIYRTTNKVDARGWATAQSKQFNEATLRVFDTHKEREVTREQWRNGRLTTWTGFDFAPTGGLTAYHRTIVNNSTYGAFDPHIYKPGRTGQQHVLDALALGIAPVAAPINPQQEHNTMTTNKTYNPDGTEFTGDSGYIVSIRSTYIDISGPMPHTSLNNVLQEYLRSARKLNNPRILVGTYQCSDGRVSVDLNLLVDDQFIAERLGRRFDQEAIYDVSRQVTLECGGNAGPGLSWEEIEALFAQPDTQERNVADRIADAVEARDWATATDLFCKAQEAGTLADALSHTNTLQRRLTSNQLVELVQHVADVL